MSLLLEMTLALGATAAALATRPWRAVPPGGPPWPWMAWWAALPALWGVDRLFAMPAAAQPLSGACLLMLMAGWPLTVLALWPAGAALWLIGDLPAAEALQRGVWLGLVPATLGMVLGAAIRRGLPHHLFVYILGRGFFATAIAGSATGALAAWLHGVPGGLTSDDVLVGRWLAAWADAWLAGMFAAIFVAFRPEWLATYADRIYLPVTPPPGDDRR